MLRERRDLAAANAFFRSAKAVTGTVPDRVTSDGHDAYPQAIRTTLGKTVTHRTNAYLNNRLEQDHRGVKGRIRCMRGFGTRRLITDGLRSYGAALREVLPDVRHRTSRYLNNRAENSRRPTRRRERQMQQFKSATQAQQFLSAHGMIYGHFRPRRHLMAADAYRRDRARAFRIWR